MTPVRALPVHSWFLERARRHPARVALDAGHRQMTYAALARASADLARALRARGLRPGDVVPIVTADRITMITAVLATLRARVACVPLLPDLPDARLAALMSTGEPRIVLTDDAHRDRLAALASSMGSDTAVVAIDACAPRRRAGAGATPDRLPASKPDDFCYVFFTSGSTGQPKAIAGRLQAIDHFIRWEIDALGLEPGLRVSQLISPMFDAFLRDAFVPLCVGGTVCIPPADAGALDPERLVAWLEAARVEVVHCVPSLFRHLMRAVDSTRRLPCLRDVLFSGEPLLPADVAQAARWFGRRVRLVNLYGPSETTMTKFAYVVAPEAAEWKSIPIGRPIPGASALLMDDRGRPSPAGAVGEIWIRTPYRSLGYYHQPELTAEAFVPNPFTSDPNDLVYRTGDLARVREDGEYEFLWRRDGQVKIRGQRIELSEIENAIRLTGLAGDCAVIDREDASGERFLCAYLVGARDVASIREHLTRRLPGHLMPGAFVSLAALPLTASGKVDRAALPAPDDAVEREEPDERPLTPTEEILAAIWAEVLRERPERSDRSDGGHRSNRIGRRDDFFVLGGHSLRATQVIARMRTVLGVDLPVRQMFESSVLEDLAAQVDLARRGGVAAPPLTSPSSSSPTAPLSPRAPLSGSEPAPLSFAQQRLWFLDQLDPGRPTFNVPYAMRLDGPLHVRALASGLTAVVARHDVLRTSFPIVASTLTQRVAPTAVVAMPMIDLQALGVRGDDVVRELARRAARQPFDLVEGPPLRAALVRLAAGTHVMLVTLHHIACDGWSIGLLISELTEQYAAGIESRPPVLPPLPIQYADFARWQRGWLTGDVLEHHLAYWRRELAGVSALELPTDGVRPPVETHRGATMAVKFPAALSAALKTLARETHTTLFMTLTAAFQLLLARVSGQRDFAIGTDIANRTFAETEPLVGFFVNQLVVRAALDGEPTFRELLGRVRERLLGAYTHQDVPFESLVEELAPRRDLSRAPLFQVKLVLQNLPARQRQVADLSAQRLEWEGRPARLDLTVLLEETDDGLAGLVEYAADLFTPATIARLMGQWESLLTSAAAQPDAPALALPLMTARDSSTVQTWSTGRSIDVAGDLPGWLAAQASTTPDAIAIVDEASNAHASYAVLTAQVTAVATELKALGVGPDICVALALDPGPALIVGVLAVLDAGGAYVPLDAAWPVARVAAVLDESHAPVILTHAARRERLPVSWAHVLTLDTPWPPPAAPNSSHAPQPLQPPRPDQLAYVLYTSGSTGRPKGVLVTHAGLANYLHWATRMYADAAGAATRLHTPIGFDLTVTSLFIGLLGGRGLRIASSPDLETLHTALASGAPCDVLKVTPSHLRGLAHWPAIPRGTIKTCVAGGEILTGETVAGWWAQAPGSRVINEYGPTETTVGCCWYDVPSSAAAGPMPIGQPIDNTQVYVAEPSGLLAAPGVSGELLIGGAGVARGYLGQPALTAERFAPDPFSGTPGSRLYRSGDRARWRADGVLEYLGRLDAQVKLRGYRIEPGEIEAVLRAQPGVRDVVVILHEDDALGARLVAYVVSGSGGADVDAWDRAMRERLPGYMAPAAIVPLAALPLTVNGKLDVAALPAPEAMASPLDGAAPMTPIEQILTGIWSDVLVRERVGRHDDFFALGGHSLLATQVMARVRAALSTELPLRTLFEAPTIAGLAARIDAARRDGADAPPPLVSADRSRPLPLSFAQQRLWFLDQLEPGQATYNQPYAVRLAAAIELRALAHAFTAIVARHEVLRTSFPARNGAPVQNVNPPAPVPLPLIDLQAIGGSGRAEAVAHHVASREARRPFDLASGTPLRVAVMRLAAADHVLLVTLHHIASDAWSLTLLVNELAEAYAAAIEHRSAALRPLPIQYADFASWQRGWLQGDAGDRQLAYWRRALADLPALELPYSAPRPAIESHRGATRPIRFSPELTAALKALGRDTHTTLFMTLVAGFQLLLARISTQRDFAIGTDIANRMLAETEPLLGFFINQLVLRVDLEGDPTFRDVLARVRERLLDAYAHQDLPFERLVEELASARDLSRAPLFQVKLVLQNLPWEPRAIGPLPMTPFGARERHARLDLTLLLEERDGIVGGVAEYATDLFTADAIDRLVAQWQTLLAAAVAQPDEPSSTLPLMPASEEAALRTLGTGLLVPVDDASEITSSISTAISSSISIAGHAAVRPDAIAIAGESGSTHTHVSYEALAVQVSAVAATLKTLGVGPDVCVALALDPGAALVVAIFAVLEAGGAYVPLEASWPAARVAAVLDETQAPVILTQEARRERLPASWAHVLTLDVPLPPPASPDAPTQVPLHLSEHARPDRLAHGQQLAIVLYTSGSTGRPKGVLVTRGGLANYLHWATRTYAAAARGGTRLHTPIGFDLTVTSLFTGLLTGHGLRIAASPDLDMLHTALASGTPHGVLKVTPSHLRGLAAWAGTETGTNAATGTGRYAVQTCVVGGEALTGETLRDWWKQAPDSRVINEYGPTEATVGCCWYEARRDDAAGAVPIGHPIANTQVYVVEPGGVLAPPGVAGELWVGGAGLGRGYLGQPGVTAARFVPDPFGGEAGARLYRTGDRALWGAGGVLEYLGRFDTQVKLRGYRVELGEIETVLREQQDVRDCVVMLRDDAPGDPRLVAYVVADTAAAAAPRAVRGAVAGPATPATADAAAAAQIDAWGTALRARLPEYMTPSAFVILDRLPLTSNGKLDRRALPAPSAPPAGESGAAAEHTRTGIAAVAEIVRGIWAAVLHHPRVADEDDFFALGGHSLLATQVIARIRTALGVELPLRTLFEVPALAAFAERVDAVRKQGVPVAPPISASGDAASVLSFAQQRLWFLDQLHPGHANYNVPYAVRVNGALDVRALAAGFTVIAGRHDVLRTCFPSEGGAPVPRVMPPGPVRVPLIDLQGLPGARAAEAVARRLVHDDAVRAFDLAHGPVLRVALLRLAPASHVLTLTLQHIACDAWSMGVLMREFTEVYAALVERREARLPDLPVQYGDFARWQRDWVKGAMLDEHEAWWRTQLANLPVLELPADAPRAAVEDYRGARLQFRLTDELAAGLRRVARTSHATLFMTLLAAFEVLLARISGQRDFAIGTATAGRTHTPIEPLIGFFVNTLSLRTALSGDPSVRDLLVRVRETVLEADAHQEMPFERLVEILAPERDLSRPPLHQVAFVFENAEPVEPMPLPGLSLDEFPFGFQAARLELRLHVRDTAGGIAGLLEYPSNLFHRETVERLLACFIELLTGMVSTPDAPVFELPMATQTGESRPAIPSVVPTGVIAQVEAQVDRQPDAIAAVDATTHLTYMTLDARANQVACTLQELGVTADVCVAVCLPRGVTLGIAWLGVLKAGGAYVPLDATYPAARLAHMLDTTGAALVLTDSATAPHLPSHWGTVLKLDADEGVWQAPPARPASVPGTDAIAAAGDALAYVIFTSGSTGQPKGVGVSRRALGHLAAAQQDAFGAASDTVMQFASASFDASVWEWLLAWPRGGRLIFDAPEALESAATREAVTMLTVPPSVLGALPSSSLSSVATLVLAGEASSGELIARWANNGRRVYDAYGPTEATVCATMSAPLTNTADIGRPLARTRVYVVEPGGILAPIGVAGELCIGGAGLARGYLHQPGLTAERFVPDPFSGEPGARLYRTGDRARLRADGTLDYLGRLDVQVKLRGHRIEPGEVEAALAAQPGVRQCAVVLREDTPGDPRLVAYVVASAARADRADPAAWRSALADRLPEYMLPSAFVVLERLPLTVSGKLDRRALPAPDVVPAAPAGEGPRTPVEEILASLWTLVLHRDRIGRHEDFFALGGHSLLATQLVGRIRRAFGMDVPLRAVFEHPTIASLAEHLSGSRATAAPAIVRVPRTGRLPLSFAQQRLWFLDRLDPGMTAYNTSFSLRLNGRLDTAALTRSVRAIMRRHEVLRTTIALHDDVPWQMIAEDVAFHPSIVDVRPVGDRAGAVMQEVARRDVTRGFDLANGPLLRALLFRLAPREHVLVVTMHHITSDNWSANILVREFAALYRSFASGVEPTLPDLTVQYADYAVWQRELLSGAASDEQVRYWRQQLDGLEPAEIPPDAAGAGRARHAADVIAFSLDDDIAARVKRLSRAENVTPFMTLLAAFQVLLGRYASRTDVAVGTPISGRVRPEIEPLIGFFVNTLVLRTSIEGRASFRSLLARVRQVTLDAYAHQDVPFDKLVEELAPARVAGRTPYFQTMFSLQQTAAGHEGEVRLPDLDVTPYQVGATTTPFDVIVNLFAGDVSIGGVLRWDADLFQRRTMERFLAAYVRLLTHAVANPECAVDDLEMLSAEEKDLLGRDTTIPELEVQLQL